MLKSCLCLIRSCDLSYSSSKLQEKQWRLDRRASTLPCQEKQSLLESHKANSSLCGIWAEFDLGNSNSSLMSALAMLPDEAVPNICSHFCQGASLPSGQWQDRCCAHSSVGIAKSILIIIDWINVLNSWFEWWMGQFSRRQTGYLFCQRFFCGNIDL